MTRDELDRLADNPNHIPGIYNYCDRWCERCPLTARCLLYATEKADEGEPGANDINNQAFWDRLGESFALTMQMIQEDAARLGIDLNAAANTPEAEAMMKADRLRQKKAKKSDLAKQAMKYTQTVNKWFKKAEKLFNRKKKELIKAARLELPGTDPLAEANDLTDATDVIRWYQHQIYIKLRRAVSSQLEEEEEENDDESGQYPSDADVSAKIALIGLDRSLAAWTRLRPSFPEQAEAIIDILVPLGRIRRQVEEQFPKARALKRPGFDVEVPME